MVDQRLNRFYDEKYAHEVSGAITDAYPVVRWPANRFSAAVATLVDRVRNKDVVELAAGSGVIAQSIALAGGDFASWTLTDWAPNRVLGMRNRLDSDPRFKFSVVDASVPTDLLPSQSFDVVVSIALVEHLIDPLGALTDARALLRPGGILYLDTPNIAKWTRRIKLALGRFPSTASRDEGLLTYDGLPAALHDEGHLHYFTFRSIERILVDRCGFSRVERIPYWASGGRLSPATATLARISPTLFSEIAIIAHN